LVHALDEYLVLLAQAGNREAFGRLAARWSPRLLAFTARSTGHAEAAKDAVQETWERALRSLRRLEGPARFLAWIYAIARRKCADAVRAKYRGQRIASAAADHAGLEVRPASDADAHLDQQYRRQWTPRAKTR
jgi:RNA polymerase sigma-70 factor (ECF subfamily)